jgi:hypothetical protein
VPEGFGSRSLGFSPCSSTARSYSAYCTLVVVAVMNTPAAFCTAANGTCQLIASLSTE